MGKLNQVPEAFMRLQSQIEPVRAVVRFLAVVPILAAAFAQPSAQAAPDFLREVRPEMIVTDEARKHWSFLPLKSPALPAVRSAGVVCTPVDRFIVARLEESRLTLSPQADTVKLVRRICFDLIGLPPTSEQIETFVDRKSVV